MVLPAAPAALLQAAAGMSLTEQHERRMVAKKRRDLEQLMGAKLEQVRRPVQVCMICSFHDQKQSLGSHSSCFQQVGGRVHDQDMQRLADRCFSLLFTDRRLLMNELEHVAFSQEVCGMCSFSRSYESPPGGDRG